MPTECPLKAHKLLTSSLWWKGPEWLTHHEKWDIDNKFNLHPDLSNKITKEWPISVKVAQISVTGGETRTVIQKSKKKHIPSKYFTKINVSTMFGSVEATVNKKSEKSPSKYFWAYSHYRDLIHFFIGLNLIKKWIKTRTKTVKTTITANDFAVGERLAIRTMQREAFPKELELLEKGQKVIGPDGEFAQLKLYLDCHGIIRLHGRCNDEALKIANKPILFAYNHPLTILYILNRHKCLNCSSVNYTLNQIRRDIHSSKLRIQIRELISKCL